MQPKHPQQKKQTQSAARLLAPKLLAGVVAMALGASAWAQTTSSGTSKGGATGAAAAKGAPRISGNVVKIGVLTDMSGLYADLGGEGSVVAAKMAMEDFGGRVLGLPIEVIGADHLNKADVGANKVREWYDTQNVDMVTDALNSAVAIAIGKVSHEKNRLAMIVGAGSSRLSNEDCNPNTIHYAYDTYALGNISGNAVVKAGGKSWFFLTADYAFGHSLESDTAGWVKKSGGEVKGAVRHPLNASDFSSFLLQAQASKAQVVGLANAGGDTINAIKAAVEFGLTRNQALAGLLVFITDIHSLGLQTTQGMYVADGWYWDLNDETRRFGKRFFERTKKMPTMVHAGSYSSTLQYLRAVQATGTDDARVVVEHLRKNRMNDLFHKNAVLREDGRVVRDMYLMQVKKPSESKYPWDYYHVRATVPGDQAFQPLAQGKCAAVRKS
jgi:branched-chain amino acid transport system substrate-binding protein